jgi:hypothetical protein
VCYETMREESNKKSKVSAVLVPQSEHAVFFLVFFRCH